MFSRCWRAAGYRWAPVPLESVSMRLLPACLGLSCLLTVLPLHAQDLAATCHASSSYDVTVNPDSILFDRSAPAPLRVQLQQGSLRTDGSAVRLSMEDQDRLTLFERDLRALLPRVRLVADHGVDMAVQSVRAEAAGMGLGADTMTELDNRLDADARQLKQRSVEEEQEQAATRVRDHRHQT